MLQNFTWYCGESATSKLENLGYFDMTLFPDWWLENTKKLKFVIVNSYGFFKSFNSYTGLHWLLVTNYILLHWLLARNEIFLHWLLVPNYTLLH